MTTIQVVTAPIFDEYHFKYKCCCSCCHVKVGTLLLGIWSAIGLLFIPYNLIVLASRVNPTAEQYDVSPAIISVFLYSAIVLCFLEATAVVCLFVGWAKERSGYLIPYLVMMGIRIFTAFVGAVLFGVIAVCSESVKKFVVNLLLKGGEKVDQHTAEMIANGATVICVVFAVSFILGGLIDVWFFTVIRSCGKFFDDKAAFRNQAPNLVTLTAPQNQQGSPPPEYKPPNEDADQQGFKYARMN